VNNPTIQDVKKFWDGRPCNIRHSSAPIGTKIYFDEVEARRYFVEPHIPIFCEFESWKNQKVLEIGCGIGTEGINFSRSGANYTGLELSGESLKIAQQRFSLFELPGRFILGDAEEADQYFSGETFDLIYSFGVIHHTLDIKKALRSMRLLSHNGTQIKVMIYARESYKQALIEEGLEQPEAQYGCPIANTYTVSEAEVLFKDAGFKNIKIRQDHIFPYEVEAYRNYQYKKHPWFEAMPAAIYDALRKNFGWHLLIDASA
jgi:SAM-dependent methyltransferase